MPSTMSSTSSRGCLFCLSVAASAIASVIIILGSLPPIQGNPLVYPNRFSFQKTSTTSTTQVPLLGYDHSNSTLDSESRRPSSYRGSFRYDIAAWVVGALLLVCLLFVILYPRMKRRTDIPSSPSCYPYPINSHLKTDLDSASIIGNANSEMS